jgi:hypothetical protein
VWAAIDRLRVQLRSLAEHTWCSLIDQPWCLVLFGVQLGGGIYTKAADVGESTVASSHSSDGGPWMSIL